MICANSWMQFRSYHCLLIHGLKANTRTVEAAGGPLKVVKSTTSCSWRLKLTEKKHSKQFNPQLLLFFQARHRRKHQAKHNAKDDARPKAKAAYHHMNELAEDSDEEEMGNDNDEPSEDEDNDQGDKNNNGNRQINVYEM